MNDLPVALPLEQWPAVPIRILAQAATTFGWKRARLPGVGIVEWFAPDGTRLGQLDEVRSEIWLSTELADNEAELLRTIGHELEHAVEHHHGHGALFDEKRAALAGDRFVEAWHQREAELLRTAAASGLAPAPFQRLPFPGETDAAFDPLADLKLESKHGQPVHASYSYERGAP